MKVKFLGAASLAAIALVACAKKEAAPAVVEETAAVTETAETAADADAQEADVYEAPAAINLASIRTKDALTAASDAAFAQIDADADGALSANEFYSLAALMAPVGAADGAVEEVADTMSDTVDAAAGEVASASVADAAAATADAVLPEEPTADASSIDASFAAIAGTDGSLSKDDLRAALLSRFDAADANLDGTLDDAESASFAVANLF